MRAPRAGAHILARARPAAKSEQLTTRPRAAPDVSTRKAGKHMRWADQRENRRKTKKSKSGKRGRR